MAIDLKAMHLCGEKFDIYMYPMGQERLRCMLGLYGVRPNTKPQEFVTHLKSQGIDARVEADTNACGQCELFCLWNDCFSIPFVSLHKILTDVWQAAEYLYAPCQHVDLVVVVDDAEYSFVWWPDKIRYVNLEGMKIGVANSIGALDECENTFPVRSEGKVVAVQFAVAPDVDLLNVLERVCGIVAKSK